MPKPTIKAVKVALKKLSTGAEALVKAYEGVKDRIDGQAQEHCDLAKSVTSWITYAQRPLDTVELQHALAVELGGRELDQDNIPDVELMVSVCAGLVTVDRESNIIRLVHYTAQEYFESIRTAWIPDAPVHVALTCITYLSFDTFASGRSSSEKKFQDRLKQNWFLSYAASYWGRHAGPVQGKVKEAALAFLQDNALVSCATQVLRSFNSPYGYSVFTPTKTTGLHLLAYFGLQDLMAYLLELGVETNSTDSNGETPLSWAAGHGHIEVVKLLLLQDGVDADSKDQRSRTPLSWAAENGHIEVVKLLLQSGVEADSKDQRGRTPLSKAAENGHEEVVDLLLARDDVDTRAVDPEYENKLT